MIIIHMLIALILTDLIESATAFALGYRGLQIYIVILLINIITNPALNLIMQVVYLFFNRKMAIGWVLFLEILVVVLEWRILVYVYPKRSKQMLCMSAVMNAASYVGGIIIFGI